MNYLEFKRQLMVDPLERGSEFESALQSDPKCRAAAEQANEFEAILLQAIDIPVPDDLLDGLTEKINDADQEDQVVAKPRMGWVRALAAGLVMGVGLAATVLYTNDSEQDELQDYLVEHWGYDGEATEQLAATSPMSSSGVNQLLSSLDLQMASDLMSNVVYVRNCGAPSGDGIHMVVQTDGGLLSVFYVPGVELDETGARFQSGNHNILLAKMPGGALAVFASDERRLNDAAKDFYSGLKSTDI